METQWELQQGVRKYKTASVRADDRIIEMKSTQKWINQQQIRWYKRIDQLSGRQGNGNHPNWREKKLEENDDSLRDL